MSQSTASRTAKPVLYKALTYAGTLPFVLSALALLTGLSYLNIPVLNRSIAVETVISTYGLLIASFMAGAHWGQHLGMEGVKAIYLALVSNIIALALWFGYLLLPFIFFNSLLIISFSLLLLIDRYLHSKAVISRDYFSTRCMVTNIVVASLIVAGFAV